MDGTVGNGEMPYRDPLVDHVHCPEFVIPDDQAFLDEAIEVSEDGTLDKLGFHCRLCCALSSGFCRWMS